jgi:hypothetical protein
MSLRRNLPLIAAAIMALQSSFGAVLSPVEAARRGRVFLSSLLDTNLNLLPEYRGARVYWLFHDNYLAAKVLARSHPDLARTIQMAIQKEGIIESGKIELIFGEAKNPLPFREFQLRDVRQIGDKLIRTEVVTDRLLTGWREYADLLLLACIAQTNRATARQNWDDAVKMWDGKGFLDAAAKQDHRYATYKLGLALLAAKRLPGQVNPPGGVLEKLLSLQDQSGGWITDYNATGQKIGVANVETTCLAILGLEALQRPSD